MRRPSIAFLPLLSALVLAACAPETQSDRPANPPPAAKTVQPATAKTVQPAPAAAATPIPAAPRREGGLPIDWRPTPGSTLPALWVSATPVSSTTGIQSDPDGTPCWRLTHTAPPAPAPTHAFYRVPLAQPLVLPPTTDLVLEADITVHPQVPPEVVTAVNLVASIDGLGDGDAVLAHDNILHFQAVVPRPERQHLVSLPASKAAWAVLEPRLRKVAITGLALLIDRAQPGRPFDIELRSLRLRAADADDRARAQRPAPQIAGLEPREYPVMRSAFRFGAWNSLNNGHNVWVPKILSNREEYALVSLEMLLAANMDTCFTSHTHADNDPDWACIQAREEVPVATVKSEIAVLHGVGISTIAKTNLGRYYHPQRTSAQAKAYIADTVAKLRDCEGMIAYYPIDEPRTDQRSLEAWRETMDAFRAADPSRPALNLHDTQEGALAYAPAEAIPCLDLYPFYTGGHMLDQVGGDALMASRILDELFRIRGTRTSWVMFAAWGNPGGNPHRLPRASELRQQAWSCLTHGARSLFYFTLYSTCLRAEPASTGTIHGLFDAGYRPVGEAGAAAIELGRDLPPAATALVGTVWQPEVALRCAGENADRLRPSWNHGADHDVIACYNRDIDRTSAGSIIIPGDLLAGRKVLDLRRDRVLTATDGGYPVCLAPGDGTLLALGDEAGIARLRANAAARRFAGDAGRFRLLALEAAANRIDIAPFQRDAGAAQAALAGDPISAQRAMAEVLARLRWTLADDAVHARAQAALERLSCAISAANSGMTRYLSDTRLAEAGPDGALVYPWNGQLESLATTYVLLRNGLFCGHGAEVVGQAHAIAAVAERFAADAALGRFAIADADAQRIAAALAGAKAFEGRIAPALGLVPAK